MLTNGKQIKQQIKRQYGTLANFCRAHKANYKYLNNTLAQVNFYRSTFNLLQRLGYNPQKEIINGKKKTHAQ